MAKGVKEKSGIMPLGDRVLIKIPVQEEKTVSGIIIPETVNAETESKRGKVVAVGEGKYEDGALVPMRVKVGDEVLFQWGDKVVIDKEEYFIVSESSISAVIK